MGDYFVMLYTQDGGYTAMMDDDNEIAKFDTQEDASECAKNNPLGEWFGYEVFEIGCGES